MTNEKAPPPLEPLAVEQWPSALKNVANDMKGAPLNVHKLMAHNPALLKAWWTFRNHSVAGGVLGPRRGELVILRVSVHLGAWYEWASHVDRALQCGLTLEEIHRVAIRDVGEGWTAPEAALLQAVDDLVERRSLLPETRRRLASHFSDAELLDVMAIQGMYQILGAMILTWGLPLDPEVAARIERASGEDAFHRAAAEFQHSAGRA